MTYLPAVQRFLLALACMLPMFATAQHGLVWAVSTPTGVSYLVGVSHLSSQSDFREGLPRKIADVISTSKAVYLETNLVPMGASSPATTRQWIGEIPARYPTAKLEPLYEEPLDIVSANRRLTQQVISGEISNPLLPPAFLQRLDHELEVIYSSAAGRPNRSVTAVKNGFAAASDAWLVWEIQTTLGSLARIKSAQRNPGAAPAAGLDYLLMAEARKQHKQIGMLESFPETLQTFSILMNADNLLEQNLISLIDESLQPDPNTLLYSTTHPVYTGNVADLERAANVLKEKSEIFRRVQFPSTAIRNRRWVPRVVELINSDKCPCLFAVGGLHLIGPDGLPALLTERGVNTSRVGLE